ncbi:MAG: acyloxyacyl hydrolase [Prevotella sp.]|nr:acyloxyacyl hydrolase [Prevotella sp.]
MTRRFMSCLLIWLSVTTIVRASTGDSLRHWGYGVAMHPNWQQAFDKDIRAWLYDNEAFAVNVEAIHSALPSDSSAIDADFGYPTLAVGLRYGDNHRVTMRKGRTTDGSFSPLGNTLTLYGTFSRPLFRTRHWEADYAMGTGIGYSSTIYNKEDDIDNELIGSHLSVYFNVGLHLTYHPVPDWGIKAGVEFCHHSNGALARPNKGANSLGPSLSLAYTPYYKATVKTQPVATRHKPLTFVDLSVGVGGKTLLEEWRMTQALPKSDPDYCTEDFTFYMTYSLHAKLMRRYARRWASGVGVDLHYGSFSSRLDEIDRQLWRREVTHSPWSVGVSANHNVYYHNMTLQMALGYYLYHETGFYSERLEDKPYYERIGLFYSCPSLNNLSLGVSLNAHMTKADFTEIVISYPIKL